MAMLGQDHQNLFQDQNRDPVHDQGQDYQRKILVGLHLEGLLPDVLLLDGQHQCGQDLEIGEKIDRYPKANQDQGHH